MIVDTTVLMTLDNDSHVLVAGIAAVISGPFEDLPLGTDPWSPRCQDR